MESYNNYSREELIQEIVKLKRVRNFDLEENTSDNRILVNMITLRKTISDVLSHLLNTSDSGIDQALLIILHYFNVDRVYIGIFDEQRNVTDFTHEVTHAGITSMREAILRQLQGDEIPWWMNKIKSGEDIIVYDVSRMPEEAVLEQPLLQMQGILSLLALPVFSNGKPCGFIGLDSVRKKRVWNALDIENLRVLADIVAIAIEREHSKMLMENSAKEMLKSEAKFRIIFEKLPWGVELYDEEGNLLDINEADLNIFGTERERVLGVNAFKNPNIPAWVNEKLKKGEDATFALNYNFHMVKNTGYYDTQIQDEAKHLLVKGIALKDAQNKIFGYLYIVFDDTENYNKTELTNYNLAKLKVAVDTGDSIIWEYDAATEKLTVDFSLNEHVDRNQDLYFIKKHQVTNLQEFIDTLHPDDVEKVYNRKFKRLLNGEIDNYVAIYRRILNGRLFWFHSNVRSYKFKDDGTPSKVVSYTSNITHQRESENELLRVKEADKLKSAFLANMSHEIRTPLNAIVGFSDIITETDNPREQQEYLDIIHKNNDLLLHLIDDILDFSKIESGTLDYRITEFDIKELCKEVQLAHSVKMKPEVKLLFDDNLPSVRIETDMRRIMQVIANFVNNAIKFTIRGNITIGYKEEKDGLQVYVKDTGIGIAEKDRHRIFERFIKLNDFHQGTGLGLTISKTIVESLGGEIGVDSARGSGSTFWIKLPLSKKGARQATGNAGPSTETEPAKKVILIAEDTHENYQLMKSLLNKQYQLYHAWNGQEAVDLFKQKQPDLILMDIRMPVMDGFEATCHIREISETVPVIALTAFAFEKEKKMAKECHFTDYVVKPVDINELLKLIAHFLSIYPK